MSTNPALTLALIGNPNCGKTALFNLLTGARQKVANYAGVTVERRSGEFADTGGRRYQLLDLPGTYSLHASSADEVIARDAVLGGLKGERQPDLMVVVLDATNLHLGLRLVLELKDKVGELPAVAAAGVAASAGAAPGGYYLAREALISLGYNFAEAELALAGCEPDAEVEELVKDALKKIGTRA